MNASCYRKDLTTIQWIVVSPEGVLRDRYTQHDNAISYCHSDRHRREESRLKYRECSAEMLTPSSVLRDRNAQDDRKCWVRKTPTQPTKDMNLGG